MRALSVQQPWAWLIVNGYKPVENRSWPTPVRGRVLIHAGKKYDEDGEFWVRGEFPNIPLPDPKDLDFGGVVGEVTITGCVTDYDSDFFFGPYGFTLADAKPLPFVPMRGQLGFFAVDYPTPTEARPDAG